MCGYCRLRMGLVYIIMSEKMRWGQSSQQTRVRAKRKLHYGWKI